MIAPKIVSHVQPSGRDYSGTSSPDLITEVPGARVLSERTIAKVLERPAHLPTPVMLACEAGAQRLADMAARLLRSPALRDRAPIAYEQTRQALADFREA